MNAETENAETENAKTENAAIENALTVVNLKPPAVITDGWDAAAIDMAAHPMKGIQSANFDNGAFFRGKEKTLIKPEERFIAIDVREGWMFLKKDTPPEFVMRLLGKHKPPRPDSFTDQESWPFKFNSQTERDDPWKYNRFVFLLDPQSAQVTVFNTHTFGGDIGVNELAKAIQTMRAAHPGAVPIVQLESRQWKTKFGMRPRPFFNIVGWHFKDNAPQPPTDSNGQGGGPIKTINAFDDEIPF
jgi:hypothetical protein